MEFLGPRSYQRLGIFAPLCEVKKPQNVGIRLSAILVEWEFQVKTKMI